MENKLYIITLEKIEKRYTKQWHKYWKKEFSKNFKVIYIDGTHLTDTIETGKFLDVNKTNVWKAEQTKKISDLFLNNKIKDNDTFIFMDGWHFGITALKYMSQLQNINIKIYTYLHAGSWDKWDFISQAGLNNWAKYNECGWINACNGHFVATNFHKNLICKYFKNKIKEENIKVVGFPMNWEKEVKQLDYKKHKKELVVFPHRIDNEKQPEVFDNLRNNFKDTKFVKTIEVTNTKKEYYKYLKQAKIVFSASKQETYGIGTVEGVLHNCIPIVPYALSYKEMYPKEFMYKTIREAKEKIQYYLKNYNNEYVQNLLHNTKKDLIDNSLMSIQKMSNYMLCEIKK